MNSEPQTPDALAQPRTEHPTRGKILIAAVAIYGLAMRVWLTFGNTGALDSDMAVLGLMARRAQQGHPSVFHWGQFYGGAQETYIAAILGIFGGVKLHTLYATTILLSMCVTVMVGLVAKELYGKRAGWLSAGIFWIWPGPFVWWSVKIGSNYWYAAFVAAASIYVLLRIRNTRDASLKRLALVGFLLGQTFWANPQAGFIVIPGVLLCIPSVYHARAKLKHIAIAAMVGLVGSLAFWIQNINHGWKSFRTPPGESVPLLRRLKNMVEYFIPQVSGFQVPFNGKWIGGTAVGVTLCIIFVAVFVFIVYKTRPRPRFLLITTATTLGVFSIAKWSSYANQPRYLFWIAPWFVMLLAVSLTRLTKVDSELMANQTQRNASSNKLIKVCATAITVLALISTVQLHGLKQTNKDLQGAPDIRVPVDDSDLIALLDENNVKFYFGDYWLTYRVVFETNGRIIGAPEYTDRWIAYRNQVIASGNPPHVFMASSTLLQKFLGYCAMRDIKCEVKTKGSFALVQTNQLITGKEWEKYQQISDTKAPWSRPDFS